MTKHLHHQHHLLPRTLLALVLGSATLGAQTSRDKAKERERERNIERTAERTAEQIGRVVERSVDAAMKVVEHTVRDLDWNRHSNLPQGGSRLDSTFAFSADGVIDLSTISGDIVVTGWTRGEVRINASTERGTLRWRVTRSRVTIETEPTRGRLGDTKFELSVPQGVRVIARTTSGDITVKGTKGAVDVNTTGGDVDVQDATDRIEIQSISGDVRAARLRGEVEAGSVGGSVELEDVEGRSVRAESTSGDLVLDGVNSRDVAVSTVSGEVEFRGPILAGGSYEFQSHSGNVTLSVPSTVSARFSIQTFNGELDSQFPVTLQPDRNRRQGRQLEFTLGGGEARVTAETFSGNIEIRRESRR